MLHYAAGERADGGDLLLIDAGCELDGYASDITRTFPADGRFSPAQRELYEIVHARSGRDGGRPARARASAAHDARCACSREGMLDAGLLDATRVGGATT